MNLQPRSATSRAPADRFTGDVWVDMVPHGEGSMLRCGVVRFSPGSHTAWHRHALGQTLHVTEGRGFVQARGGEVIELRAGDTAWTPPGEWHWHGASPDAFMTHLALSEDPGDDHAEPATLWGELLSADEYPPKVR